MLLGPDSGQHQQLRRVDRSRWQYHLAFRLYRTLLSILRTKSKRNRRTGRNWHGFGSNSTRRRRTSNTLTPVALLPTMLLTMLTFVTVAFMATWRFLRSATGVMYDLTAVVLTPFLLMVWATVKPVILSPTRSSVTPKPTSSAAFMICWAKGGWYGNLSKVQTSIDHCASLTINNNLFDARTTTMFKPFASNGTKL